MEVSEPGLACVADRVQTFTRDFLRGQLDLPEASLVRVYAASFPEEVTSGYRLPFLIEDGAGTAKNQLVLAADQVIIGDDGDIVGGSGG